MGCGTSRPGTKESFAVQDMKKVKNTRMKGAYLVLKWREVAYDLRSKPWFSWEGLRPESEIRQLKMEGW